MLKNLSDPSLQPEQMKGSLIPEIKLSESIRHKLVKMFEEEEKSYVEISDSTSKVLTDKNYVLFPNQWFYLAVISKKFAMVLFEYSFFFDKTIRNNNTLKKICIKKDFNNREYVSVFQNAEEANKMRKYIEGSKEYRPGKKLINGNDFRSTVDVFGSCVLAKLNVPAESTTYLGHIVYYLCKRPDLYALLEEEIDNQTKCIQSMIKLPSGPRDCAKAIVDCMYNQDHLRRLSDILEINDKNIKIKTNGMDGEIGTGNYLRYLFARPASELFEGKSDKPRVFTNKDYDIETTGGTERCRLTTEWVDTEMDPSGNGNYLKALIVVANRYYSEELFIDEKPDGRYLRLNNSKFVIRDMPAVFDSGFVRRLITALIAKPFVILTGNSGTGKTRIARQLAEYLEVRDEEGKKNWSLVPVGADWTDNTRILGYFNPLANEGKGSYVKTEILRLIEKANAHSSVPYFLILDEMNLSHVERYFSDFLSHMETPGLPLELDGYEGELKYPENLFVIGTVNIDETTYMFSPKVLDRANVIEFKPERSEVLGVFDSAVSRPLVFAAQDGSAEAFLNLSGKIQSGKIKGLEDFSAMKELFGRIYEIAERSGYEFAYRTVKEIRQYMLAAYELCEDKSKFDPKAIYDEQLLQKILPKIHGNKKEIGDCLGQLEKLCKENGLDLSGEKIRLMEDRLSKVQYASFI